MNITSSFSGTDQKQAQAFAHLGETFLARLMAKMNRLVLLLQAKIVGEKLSGQVLQHRTGKLAGSIRVQLAKVEGDAVIAGVQGAGGPAFYGAVHEFGGRGPYTIQPVNKKALRFMMGGKAVFAKMVRHPALPERSFMRSAANEMKEQIQTEIASVVQGK